jgi:hypothetical protein
MATNSEQIDRRIVTTTEPPNWPGLISKTVDDLSNIAKTEMALFEARLQRLVEAQTEKIAGILGLIVCAAYGSLYFIAGILLFIHLWLAWWLSFLITGFAVGCVGVVIYMAMASAAKAKSS